MSESLEVGDKVTITMSNDDVYEIVDIFATGEYSGTGMVYELMNVTREDMDYLYRRADVLRKSM